MDLVFVVIAPVFGAVILGFVLFRVGIFDATTSEGLAKFVYYVAIPALLFRSLARAALPAVLPLPLIAAYYVPSIAIFGVGVLLGRHVLRWDRASQGIAGLGACYSNIVMLGLPLATTAFGASAAVPLFTLMALQSSLLFPLATYCIEVYGAREHGPRPPVYLSLGKLVMNPVIASLALGVLCNLSGWVPRGALDVLLEKLAQAATGCALVSLGVSLAQYRLAGDLRDSAVLLVVKNLVHPLLVWLACRALHVPAEWMRVAVLLAAMPSGVNAYIFAKRYGLQEAVISKTIVLSTLISSAVTTFILHQTLAH